jgi:hypothetical protein
MVASAAFCQSSRLGDSCDLSIFGVGDAKSFLAFDQELRAAITKQDAVAMAFLVQFPLRVNSERGKYSLNDPAALQSHFQEVFPSAVQKAILDQKVEGMFCRGDGVMYGNGEVWVNATNLGFAINVINLPSNAHKAKSTENKIEFVCRTDRYRIIVDSDAKRVLRYRSWSPLSPSTGKPDLELNKGTSSIEGTGGCSHTVWQFQNGQATYIVQELGCFPDLNEPPKQAKGIYDVRVGDQSNANGWCY